MRKGFKYLSNLIGEELAERIIHQFGGDYIYIPKHSRYTRNKQIIEQFIRGATVNQLSETFRLTTAQIYNILIKMGVHKRKHTRGRPRTQSTMAKQSRGT